MNLTLHHFRKEARYLLPRWWLWIGLLVVELLVNLEWIIPMTVRGSSWPVFSIAVSWLVAVVMVLTQVPEDAAASSARFIATRPLPASSYWLARGLVFLVMIVLPFAVQQGAYLALSHRPLGEVLSGMGVQAFRVIGGLGWIVPLSALWKGWRWMLATVLSIVVLNLMMQCLSDATFASSELLLLAWHVGLGVVAIGMAATLAWAHRRWEWRTWRKITAQCACLVVLSWLGWHWQFNDWNDTATDMAQAEAFTKQADITFPLENVSAFKTWNAAFGSLILTGKATIRGQLPPQFSLDLMPDQASAQDGDRALPTHPPTRVPAFIPKGFFTDLRTEIHSRMPALQPHIPLGTILSMPAVYPDSSSSTTLAALDEPLPDQNKPFTITTDLLLQWRDWTSFLELPVRAGATVSTSDSRWTLLNVRFDQGLRGRSVPGAVTIDYRVECRGGPLMPLSSDSTLLLYSPDRGMAWTTTANMPAPDLRALFTGWPRRLVTVTWDHVLRYADGEPIDMSRDNLKLIVLEPRHLGTTRMRWKSPPLKLVDHMSSDDSWKYTTDEGLYQGHELEAFERRVNSLKPPPAGAAEPEVMQYLYEALSAAATMKFDPQSPPPRLREVLAAVAKEHLAVMLQMSDSMASMWADMLSEILAPLLTEAHKPELMTHLPGRAWLAPLVMQHGWAKDAMPALVPTLKTKEPVDTHLIKLVLKSSDDDAVLRLLLENFRLHPNRGYEIIDHLVRRPSMRAEVKAVSDDLWAGFDPTLQINQDNRLRLAIKFGNATALDYALRLAALGGEPGGDGRRLVFDLPDLLGLPRKPKDAKVAELAPSYRHLKASDFEYQPDQMLWKKKP